MSQGSYYYMKLKGPDVPGSCKKMGYENWCEVNSWGLNIMMIFRFDAHSHESSNVIFP